MTNKPKNARREFIIKSSVAAGAISLAPHLSFGITPKKVTNKLPKWKGFNLLDYFSPNPDNSRQGTQEEYFKWMSDWGFDFVRIPMAYPWYLKIDHNKNITCTEHRDFASMPVFMSLTTFGMMPTPRKIFTITGVSGLKDLKIFPERKSVLTWSTSLAHAKI
jgi:hypothetical protein